MLLKSLREQVFETALKMVADDIAYGAQGNISALDRVSGLVVITPSAVPYAKMVVEDMVVLDLSGKLVEAKWRPTSELPMHLIFYNHRPEIGAVVHSHAPYATVFGIIHESIPVVLTEASTCLGGPVPVAPYCRPGTDELAKLVLDTMGSGVAVILAQHGLLAAGADLGQAYDTTMAAETSARLVIMARSMGAALHSMEPSEVAFMRDLYLTKYKPNPVEINVG
jgi:L-ribulose-5-phosphate 4-epimerase